MFIRRFALLAGTLLLLSVTVVGDQNTPTAICNDNRTPAGILAHGVLQIHLEARQAAWYPNGSDAARLVVAAFGEEGHAPQIPGPLVRVPMRVEVSATIRNSLDHTIFVHGLASRPEAGPPADPTTMADAAATLEVPVGSVREVRFNSGAAGSYYYWASNDRQSLLMRTGPDSMLSGAFVVDAPGTRDSDRVFVVNTWVPSGGVLAGLYPNEAGFRSRVVMGNHGFGRGDRSFHPKARCYIRF